MPTLCDSFKDLAEATWNRLDQAQQPGLSWGEETNTETLLMTLYERHHPANVRIKAFTRKQESLNGADWEWWIGGPGAWLGMRVQAKRINVRTERFHGLSHRTAGHLLNQMDTLISEARTDNLNPVYCFYVFSSRPPGWFSGRVTELGCLVGHASVVKSTGSDYLNVLYGVTEPWHLLVCPGTAGAHSDEPAHRAYKTILTGAPPRGSIVDPAGGGGDHPTFEPRDRLPDYLLPLMEPSEDQSDWSALEERAISRRLAGFAIIRPES